MKHVPLFTLASVMAALSATGCGSTNSTTAPGPLSEVNKAPFVNGAVCGTVLSRPDHGLDEMPITLTAGGETRFVNVEGNAFERLVEFVSGGEKNICLNADWEAEEVPTIDHFALVSVPDFHGEEGQIPATEKVKDGDYRIAQCISTNPELGGHATLNLALRVKENKITTISGPALEFAPALSARYRNASTRVDNRGEQLLDIEVSSGTIELEQKRSIESITLNLTKGEVSVVFLLPGSDDVHFDSIQTTNCSFNNLSLFGKLDPAD